MRKSRILWALLISALITTGLAWAFPSLVQHIDAPHTIKWEADGTPDGTTAHNHRRNQDFGGWLVTAEPFSSAACWDNRTHRFDPMGNFDEGHCYIAGWGDNQPTWTFTGEWPEAAMARVREAVQIYSNILSDDPALTMGLELVEVDGPDADLTFRWADIGDNNNGGIFRFDTQVLSMDSSFTWYFGADPMEGQVGGIGNGQWHFFSVLLHEIGHSLGLVHQADGSDLMTPPVGEPPNINGHIYYMGPDADTIDGLRDLYSQPWNYWKHGGGNGGSGQLDLWHISSGDTYVSGDFDGDGSDEILAINPNGWHHTMDWNGGDWQWIEGDGSGQIHWWVIDADDTYLTGDFDGDGIDELLAINPNGWHHTMRFNGTSWQFIEGDGSGQIGWWLINSNDFYVTGDFNGNGSEELLAINPNGWHQTMSFNGSWQYIEGGSSGQIGWWLISSDDRYLTGDFNGDGSVELLAINPANGWHHTMDFTGGGWNWIEGDGSGQIHWWLITSDDQYSTGDFNGDGSDDLLAINPANGWSHLMGFQPNTWGFLGGNGGIGGMVYWLFSSDDWHVSGDFDGDGVVEILHVNPNGWWHVNRFC